MEDLPSPRPNYCKLPAELNQQIYFCFNPATQRKFICGLGWDFYAMFRHKLLTKTMRICNQHGNRFNGTNRRVTITADGLHVCKNIGAPKVFAEQPFLVSGPQCRMNGFPGTICYYYEVKGDPWTVGLSDGINPNSWIDRYPNSNSYAIPTGLYYWNYSCWLAGETHYLKLPEGVIRPSEKPDGINVLGCGLVLDPEDNLWIFFTLNGQLLGRKIPINPTVDCLFPTVTMLENMSLAANFGDDLRKPFEYDIKNCPGLGLACF